MTETFAGSAMAMVAKLAWFPPAICELTGCA
jgi:hypothetical protein